MLSSNIVLVYTAQGSLTKDGAEALGGKTLTYSGEYEAKFNVTVSSNPYGTVTADKTTVHY